MESDPETRPRPRRWLRWLSVIGMLMAVMVWLYFRDESLEPADDLLPQRPSAAGVPEEENGWVQWQKVCDSLPHLPIEEKMRLEQVMSLELPPDPERDARLALDNETFLKLEAALNLPVCRNRTALTAYDLPQSTKTLLPQSEFDARLLGAIHRKDSPEILRILELTALFRKKMPEGSTSYIDLLHCLAVKSRLPLVLAMVDFSEQELATMADGDVQDPGTTEDLHEMMRHEHRMLRTVILAMNRDRLKKLEEGSGGDYPAFLYQKHATANALASYFRARLKVSLENTIAGMGQQQADIPGQNWLSLVSPNRTGEKFVELGAGERLMHSRISFRTAQQRCGRVLLALHRHWKANGSLPDELSALVPRFLPAVPADPFDKQPLRWDKARRVVYATGMRPGMPPSFLIEGKHGPTGWFKVVGEGEWGSIGVRFRRPEEGPDVPVK